MTIQEKFIEKMMRAIQSDAAQNPDFVRIQNLENEFGLRDDVIHPAASSPKRFEVMSEMMKLKLRRLPWHGFPRSLPMDISTLSRMKESYATLVENPKNPAAIAPDGFVAELETYARSLGIASIGYCKLPREYLFQGKGVLHANMIVTTMEMDKDAISKAPSSDTAVMVHRVYAQETKATLLIAEYLRKHGFSSQVCYPLLGLVLYPALAQKAGLGWQGAHGLLITPEFGPRVRLAAISTSIGNLPFSANNTNQWMEDYCRVCRQCIRNCPVQAIYEEPIRHDGLVTCIDNSKCLPQFAENQGCAVCIKVCPFSHTDSQILKQHIVKQKLVQERRQLSRP